MELLTPSQMGRVDRLAIERGPATGFELMQRAGAAVVANILDRFPHASDIHVLCGPGDNGGDGYIVADMLSRLGLNVLVFGEGPPRDGSDAAQAAALCAIFPQPLAAFRPENFAQNGNQLIVDALFGAGLARPLSNALRQVIDIAFSSRIPVVAVDLPSGVSGESAQVLNAAFHATLTVTFVRKKPGHLLYPGRTLCGQVVVADIGIGDDSVAEVQSQCFENDPVLWSENLPSPAQDAHKYSRGHVAVFSGDVAATGAARLSAMAAARIGAGAVTVLAPGGALVVNAVHLTSIMLRQADSMDEVLSFIELRGPAAFVYGPGLSPERHTATALFDLLDRAPQIMRVVVDASALTAIALEPQLLLPPFGGRTAELVLTPHEGEFRRLFPDLTVETMPSKVERARTAAKRAQAVIVYKGPDTVIASPDGRAVINSNGTALLATAGSGDVLAGFIAGLMAQRMPPFEAAAAAVWIHAEAACQFGAGLIAEDLPLAILPVIRQLLRGQGSKG